MKRSFFTWPAAGPGELLSRDYTGSILLASDYAFSVEGPDPAGHIGATFAGR